MTHAMPFYEFADGIFEIDEFDCVSIFVIVGEERALVVDCGNGIGDLRWVIEHRITDKPYDVLATHNHSDHIGGAGFFDEIWIHEADADWSDLAVPPTLKGRKWYADLIRTREDKNYDYNPETDIVEWPKTPAIRPLQDGHVFDLGGRKVTVYHCPGHTAGEVGVVDDKTKTLIIGDACNRNYLLREPKGCTEKDVIQEALAGLERMQSLQGTVWRKIYNGHHDYRGFGSPLGEDVLPNTIACLKTMLDGTAKILRVKDQLSTDGAEKEVAEYGNVQINWL